MCFLCDYIKDKRPTLKQLDEFKSPFKNVIIIKSHIPYIAQIACKYSPELVKEIQREKSPITPSTSA